MKSFKQFLLETEDKIKPNGWGLKKPGDLVTIDDVITEQVVLMKSTGTAYKSRMIHSGKAFDPSFEEVYLNGKYTIMIAKKGAINSTMYFNIVHPITLRNDEPSTFAIFSSQHKPNVYKLYLPK